MTTTTTTADLTVTRVAEGVYRVEGDARTYIVLETEGMECNCEAFKTTGSCIHAEVADEEARIEAQEAIFAAIDAEAAFVKWSADVHHNADAHLEPVW